MPLPTLATQAERLIDLGVAETAELAPSVLLDAARGSTDGDGLLVVHHTRAPASYLAPLLVHGDRPGFVVTDMTDVDRFAPIDALDVPDVAVYVARRPERGDQMSNWSPDEALPAILDAGRSPLTLTEGIHWLLQQPEVLERNHCFMTVGSRLVRDDGRLDARTPAIWISNGTGRDGRHRRHAPKVGWCWAGNRHTWLGFASTGGRTAPVRT